MELVSSSESRDKSEGGASNTCQMIYFWKSVALISLLGLYSKGIIMGLPKDTVKIFMV